MNGTEDSAILREIVRGSRPLQDLTIIGVVVSETPEGGLAVANRRGVHAVVSARDVAMGLIRLRGAARGLSAWAKYVLDAAVPVDLDFGQSEDETQLLEGLWDIAFETQPGPPFWAAAERLADA